MLSIAKPQTLSEMWKFVLKAYFPVLKKIYPAFILLYILEGIGGYLIIIAFKSDIQIQYLAIFSPATYFILLFLYPICLLRTNLLTWHEVVASLIKRFVPYVMLLILLIAISALGFFIFMCLGAIIQTGMGFSTAKYDYLAHTWPFVIPFIISYSIFSIYIFWIENKKIFQSIKESYQLVKGKWLNTSFYLLLFCIVFLIPFVTFYILSPLILNPNTLLLNMFYIMLIEIIKTIYYPLLILVPLWFYKNLQLKVKLKRC